VPINLKTLEFNPWEIGREVDPLLLLFQREINKKIKKEKKCEKK
jgi:hypothetical protein